MTKDEAQQKFIDTAELVIWKDGKPFLVDDVALMNNPPADNWAGWRHITIIHDLAGQDAVTVWEHLKHMKTPKILSADGETPASRDVNLVVVSNDPNGSTN